MGLDETLDDIQELEERLNDIHDKARNAAFNLSEYRKYARITVRIADNEDQFVSSFDDPDADAENIPCTEEVFYLEEGHTLSTSVDGYDTVVHVGDVEWKDPDDE